MSRALAGRRRRPSPRSGRRANGSIWRTACLGGMEGVFMIVSRRGVLLTVSGLLVAASATSLALAEPAPLTFGVLNQQSPALTAERWNPILHYVTSVTAVPLVLKMGATVNDTNAMMAKGAFDLMFTNHNFQSEFDGLGYRVIARWAGEPIR